MTAANLPGGPGTAGASGTASPPTEPNLPEPSPIQSSPDINGTQPGAGGPSDLTTLPPVAPLEPMTTKPRQIPGGGVDEPNGPQMPLMPGQVPGQAAPLVGQPGGSTPPAPGQFDPAASGLDQQSATPPDQSEDSAPKKAHRFVAVLTDVRRDNPDLPFAEAATLARQAVRLMQAEESDPLAVIEP